MKEQKAVTNSVLILVANLQFLIMVSLKKKKKKEENNLHSIVFRMIQKENTP